METKLKMHRKDQVILANVILVAALLFERYIGHAPRIAILAGLFLFLFVNVMFVVTWKRGSTHQG